MQRKKGMKHDCCFFIENRFEQTYSDKPIRMGTINESVNEEHPSFFKRISIQIRQTGLAINSNFPGVGYINSHGVLFSSKGMIAKEDSLFFEEINKGTFQHRITG